MQQGHIRKRGKGSWEVVINLGRDAVTGKRRQLFRSVRGTKREASALLVQLLHQRDYGIDQPPGKMTLGEFLHRWLEDYARHNVAPKTFLGYEYLVQLHITPSLGAIPLSKLRPQTIQSFYSRVLREGRVDSRGGLSPKTVLEIHRLLRGALATGVKWQHLSSNPADAVTPPRPERYRPPTFSAEEADRLVRASEQTPYGALIQTAMMTGLRRGELLGLMWRDVDSGNGLIHVRQAAQWLLHQGWTFRQPMTPHSRRQVALGPDTVCLLNEHRRRQLEQRMALGPDYQDLDLVFATPLGSPIDPSNLRRAWEGIVRDAGFSHLRFHDLRHIHATLMLSAGVHPKVVSERLGHSGIGITLDTYSHVLPDLQAEAATSIERLVAKARGA